MNLSDELREARLTVVQTAELANMHPSHLRRLYRKGIFPEPKRTAKGRPYFDYGLLTIIDKVQKTGIAANGEEVTFYRKSRGRAAKRTKSQTRRPKKSDPYLASLAEALRQFKIPKRYLTPHKLAAVLAEVFEGERPDLEVAIPAIAQRLLP